MKYEELTIQTKITIEDFIERSKSAESVHTAELFSMLPGWGIVVARSGQQYAS
jgi:hypothetical protein